MMRSGAETEQQLGRSDIIRWFECDCSSPEAVAELPLRHKDTAYDVVMANWLFDHAGSVEVLEGMFRTVVSNLKPGGLFVNERNWSSPRAAPATSGRYGYQYSKLYRAQSASHFPSVSDVFR